jgi:hypothetical protein
MRHRPEIRAVSFDVGGTLIEPWPSVGRAYAEVAARHARPGEAREDFVGRARTEMALARHVGQRIVVPSADRHDDEDGVVAPRRIGLDGGDELPESICMWLQSVPRRVICWHRHGAKVCSGAMVSRRHAPPPKRTRTTLGP